LLVALLSYRRCSSKWVVAND